MIPSTPVQVEYHLTEMGRDLEPVLGELITWSHKWIPLPEDGSDDGSDDADNSAHDSASRSA